MSFIRYKKRGNKWYVYEVNNIWNKKAKKYQQTSSYLGVALEKGGTYKKIYNACPIEKGILDFGDSFAITKIIESSGLSEIIQTSFKRPETIINLICYQLTNGSAMYNCSIWSDGNIIKKLYPKANLDSKTISKVIKEIGEEKTQRIFFTRYIDQFFKEKHGILIDSTALPSSINSSLNSWGHMTEGLSLMVSCLMLVDITSKLPIFFRAIPGGIPDVSTLKTTFLEIEQLGLKTQQAIFDAGYFSENNIRYLCETKINFISRIPKSRKIFKELVLRSQDIEKQINAVKYGNRIVFVTTHEINLYDQQLYAYVIIDPDKKAKDIKKILLNSFENPNEKTEVDLLMKYCGYFILISHLTQSEIAF